MDCNANIAWSGRASPRVFLALYEERCDTFDAIDGFQPFCSFKKEAATNSTILVFNRLVPQSILLPSNSNIFLLDFDPHTLPGTFAQCRIFRKNPIFDCTNIVFDTLQDILIFYLIAFLIYSSLKPFRNLPKY